MLPSWHVKVRNVNLSKNSNYSIVLPSWHIYTLVSYTQTGVHSTLNGQNTSKLNDIASSKKDQSGSLTQFLGFADPEKLSLRTNHVALTL